MQLIFTRAVIVTGDSPFLSAEQLEMLDQLSGEHTSKKNVVSESGMQPKPTYSVEPIPFSKKPETDRGTRLIVGFRISANHFDLVEAVTQLASRAILSNTDAVIQSNPPIQEQPVILIVG